MKFRLFILCTVSIIVSPLLGFEINTHQAITYCAITKNCNQQGAKNLDSFVINMGLEKENYSNEVFEKYNKTYLVYPEKGAGLKGKQIRFRHNNGESYIDMIEAGSILEDALYHNELFDGDGRFNNHFYSAQFYALTSLTFSSLVHGLNAQRLSNRALLADGLSDAFGVRTDNISWALQKDVSVGLGRSNDYTIHKAFEYFKNSFEGNEEKRRKNQAKLFVSLGHLVHLNHDLHSPAHVRNGPHAGGDYLEIFGRYDGGFLLRNGELSPGNDPDIFQAIRDIDINDIMLTKNNYSSYQDFYTKEALWVSKNFFSEAHDLDINEGTFWTPIDPATGEGIELQNDACWEKNTTIFDTFRNPHLDQSETILVPRTVKWNYVRTSGNASSVIGDISDKTVVALEENSFFWTKCRTMAAVVDGSDSKSYGNYDKKALKDTAKNVIPRAVASTQAFINYFFRGQVEAELVAGVLNGTKVVNNITIRNSSDPDLVSALDLLTFKAGGDFKVYYIEKGDADKKSTLLLTAPLTEDMFISGLQFTDGTPANDKFTIEGIQQALVAKSKSFANIDQFIVLFDGQIGESRGLNDYNINATGLSAAYAAEKVVKKTGQVLAYAKYDDGRYQKGATINYSRDDVNNIVTDHVTNLMWQDDIGVLVGTHQWVTQANYQANNMFDTSGETATTYCEDLSLGGYGNWRVPNIKELQSLLDYSQFNPMTSSVFINTASNAYWASTDVVGSNWKQWYVHFSSGFSFIHPKYSSGRGNPNPVNAGEDPFSVRCVRSIQ